MPSELWTHRDKKKKYLIFCSIQITLERQKKRQYSMLENKTTSFFITYFKIIGAQGPFWSHFSAAGDFSSASERDLTGLRFELPV